MKILLYKCLAVVLLLAAQCFSAAVWAQEYPEHIKVALISNPEASKTVELKDGRTVSYRQLVELPEIEREKILELVIKRSARSNFMGWELAAIEAQTEETKRRTNGIVEEFAIKLRLLASARAAQGKRLPQYYYDAVKEYADKKSSSLELKAETYHYFESLLANPDAFEK